MLAAVRHVPGLLLAPLICRALGHHWHAFVRATTMRVCDRCGFHVNDPH